LALAYGVLILFAIVPIYIGSHASNSAEVREDESIERLSKEEAGMFPVYASCALFGLYLLFKTFGKEYVNLILGGYFFLLGSGSLTVSLRYFVLPFCPASFQDEPFTFSLFRKLIAGKPAEKAAEGEKAKDAAASEADEEEETDEEWINVVFDNVDIICMLVAAGVGGWYLMTKHWIATNFYGLSFSTNGIKMFALPSFKTGAILLSGLFFYDVFWVFGTDVMVTVAKSFDAPIKVLFPKDFIENGPLNASEHAMLGLGDIVLPGVVIAMLLRFDMAQSRTSKPYFWVAYIAYFLGLLFTITIMHCLKTAQPALLYLVPAVLGAPILFATVRGELGLLFSYDEEALAEAEAASKESAGDAAKDKDA